MPSTLRNNELKISKSVLSLAISLALPSAMLFSSVAHAHGYISTPMARHLKCNSASGQHYNPSKGCEAAEANGGGGFSERGGHTNAGWLNYASAIKDGQVCSSNYRGINAPVKNGDWHATEVTPDADGFIELTYTYAAYHGTDHIAFYITKNEYNPGQVLKFSDLELLGRQDGPNTAQGKLGVEIPWGPSDKSIKYRYKLPAGQHGRHLILAAWPVSAQHGTGEVFTSCGDVIIKSTGETSSWKAIGSVQSSESIKKGGNVMFRLFDTTRSGSVAFETSFDATEEMSSSEWLYKLANQVNSETQKVQIGTLKNGEVSVGAPADNYHVYSKGTQYNHQIYLENTAPPVDSDDKITVDAGKDFSITTLADKSVNHPLQGTGKNADAYKWTIKQGKNTFWLQTMESNGWTSSVNGLNARALFPAATEGTAEYCLTASKKGQSDVTDCVKVEVTKQAQNNDQAFINALKMSMQSRNSGDSVTFSGGVTSSSAATSTPGYTWTLPAGAQGGSNGLAQQQFTIKKTHQIQHLTVKVNVKAGKESRVLQQAITVEALSDSGSHPDYVFGKKYVTGDVVKHNGGVYQCKITNWCDDTYANAKLHYEPGAGLNWTMAWKRL
jgi:predicted carbohydrate-binding protein with CBM5 and CBM33 domain